MEKVAVWREMLPPQKLEWLEIHLGNSGGEDERVERLQERWLTFDSETLQLLAINNRLAE